MKCIALVLLIAMAPSIKSDEEPTAGGCEVVVPEGMLDMHSVLHANASACVSESNLIIERGRDSSEAQTSEDFRLAVKTACDQAGNFTRCLTASKVDAQVCLEGVERTQFLLSVGLMETEFEVKCLGDGERFATINEEQRKSYDPDSEGRLDVFAQCRIGAGAHVTLSQDEVDDPNRKMRYEYNLLRQTRECLEKHRGEGHDLLVETGIAYWSDVMDRMKCVEPQGGAEVLCKTIISGV